MLYFLPCVTAVRQTQLRSQAVRFSPAVRESRIWHGEEPNVFSSLAQPRSEHGSTLNCLKCTAFYDTFITLRPDQVVELERNTRKQSRKPLWHDARKLRITASTASKVPQRETTDPDKFLAEHLYPRFQGSRAMVWEGK